jgi:hypothetical protein
VEKLLSNRNDKALVGRYLIPRMSRTNLVEAYIAALPGTVVSIVASADGLRSRFETGVAAADAIVHARLRFKDTHAELVLSICGVSGWADMAPASLLDLIISTAQASAHGHAAMPTSRSKRGALWRSSSRRSTASAKRRPEAAQCRVQAISACADTEISITLCYPVLVARAYQGASVYLSLLDNCWTDYFGLPSIMLLSLTYLSFSTTFSPPI